MQKGLRFLFKFYTSDNLRGNFYGFMIFTICAKFVIEYRESRSEGAPQVVSCPRICTMVNVSKE